MRLSLGIAAVIAIVNLAMTTALLAQKYRSYSASLHSISTRLFTVKNDYINKLPRLYIRQDLSVNTELCLDERSSHYIVNVMRMKPGTSGKGGEFRFFNGRDGEFLMVLSSIEKKGKNNVARAFVHEKIRDMNDPLSQSLPVELYCAPIKKQRMKLMLEKATELGVAKIIPVTTQNTNEVMGTPSYTTRREGYQPDMRDESPFERTIIEAAEQSERLTVPILEENVITLDKLLATLNQFPSSIANDDDVNLEKIQKRRHLFERNDVKRQRSTSNKRSFLLVCREREGGDPIFSALQKITEEEYGNNETSLMSESNRNYIKVLIGPEGGFTSNELDKMARHPCVRFVTLGASLLRSETAAMSALSCINAFLQTTSSQKK